MLETVSAIIANARLAERLHLLTYPADPRVKQMEHAFQKGATERGDGFLQVCHDDYDTMLFADLGSNDTSMMSHCITLASRDTIFSPYEEVKMTITMEEAQATLPKLLESLQPGQKVTITDQGQPLAEMTKSPRNSPPCKAGCYQKAEFWMAPDFDDPLDEFKEYMQ